MKNNTLIAVIILCALAFVMYAEQAQEPDFNVDETYGYGYDCWDFDNNKEGCLDQPNCRWDFWGKYCHEISCWDFLGQEECNSGASDMGLNCQWKAEGSSGWCEDNMACWNYNERSDCEDSDGCFWEGTPYCGEINCWNYDDKNSCEAHEENGCLWDGRTCMEMSGCWEHESSSSCDGADGCMWKSHDYCEEVGCWNYEDEDECSAESGCEWFTDEWSNMGGWCQESGACWEYETNSTCSQAGCYWNEDDQECFFADCYMYTDYNETACTGDIFNLNLNCQWEAKCHPAMMKNTPPDGDGGGELGSCEDFDGDESTCYRRGCTYYNESAEDACLSCEEFDEDSSACGQQVGCSYISEDEICDACHYLDQTECDAEYAGTGNCVWDLTADDGDPMCIPNWDGFQQPSFEGTFYINEEPIQSGPTPTSSGGGGSSGPGGQCWGYQDSETCIADSECAWGECMQQGCWDYDETSCLANNDTCTWREEMHQCEDKGCWNAESQSECNNLNSSLTDKECRWTNDNGWCEEEGCWNYESEEACLDSSLGCGWENYTTTDGSTSSGSSSGSSGATGYCFTQGCWAWDDETSCESHDDNGVECRWRGGCECGWPVDDEHPIGCTVMCGDYGDQTTCEDNSDNGCWWQNSHWCERPGCWDYNNPTECDGSSKCEWLTTGQCFEEGCWSHSDQTSCSDASCTWEEWGWCQEEGCWNYNNKQQCDQNSQCQWNDQWNNCKNLQCWSFNTESTCNQYNSTLNCFWDTNSQSCNERGCWNYWQNDTCAQHADEDCVWNQAGQCQRRECWNYKSESSCSGDSSCSWETRCEGDYSLECWNYNDDQDTCISEGCKWTGECNKQGCWSYQTQGNCLAQESQCGWEENGNCKETDCWEYYNQDDCTAVTGCAWDNETIDYGYGIENGGFCHREGCWTFSDSKTECEQHAYMDCAWEDDTLSSDPDEGQCYEQGCWDYSTKGECTTDTRFGGCEWSDDYQYCYKKGCWSKESESDCTSVTGCVWDDWGWCYDLGCSNYNTQTECSSHNTCLWDENWDYCYEKGCWDYTNESGCNSTTKCTWDANGQFCFEKGCWNNMDESSCSDDSKCYWDESWGWCENDGSCWNKDESSCEAANDSCRWVDESWGSWCEERGCWEASDSTGCASLNTTLDRSCVWNTDGGWCKEDGCWDYFTQTDCESTSDSVDCVWDDTYDYCYEKGCWELDQNECDTSGSCNWRADTWGWCEEVRCWDMDNQTACDSSTDNADCVWVDSGDYCSELACWAFDGNETLCEDAANTYSGIINCSYEDGLCEPANGFCAQFDGKEKKCMDTFYCWYNWGDNTCNDPSGNRLGFAEQAKGDNPGCWLFDADEDACEDVSICSYDNDTSSCDPNSEVGGDGLAITINAVGQSDSAVQCENITDQNLCMGLASLSNCCKWRGSQCVTDYVDKTCYDNLQEPPEGATYCEDYNSYTNEDLCDQIAGSPWYMPCRWDRDKCVFKFDDVVGSNGDIFDIKTKSLCEKAGYEWTCDQYCDDMGTPSNESDDVLQSECWCEMKAGEGNCMKSCWACETPTNTSAYASATDAQNACETSPANCEFVTDVSAPNGYGYCEFSTTAQTTGGCDSNCFACNSIADDTQTPKPETKIACLESAAECKWAANLDNNSKGTCIDKSDKTCSESCFKCSQSECENYGLGEAGSCVYNENELFCEPANFADEICFNAKDDDNDEMADCDDPDCFFAPECGEGGLMHECWRYGQQDCESSPTYSGSTMNCKWITDPFGGSWCGHPSEVCWQYDDSSDECNNQSGACTYTTSGGRCDLNFTKAEVCFGKPEGKCTGNCLWMDDENNPKGGVCEYVMFAKCHNSSVTTQQQCNKNSQYCTWMQDINSDNGGWCEPVCFGLDENSCGSNAFCELRTGWCEPNITKSEDCWQFDNDQSSCLSQPSCLWEDSKFGSECDINWDNTTYIEILCEDTYFDQSNCNADDNCIWVRDSFSGKGGYCNNIADECHTFQNESQCDAQSEFGCKWASNKCVSTCEYDSVILGTDCSQLTGCTAFSGFCEPKGAGMMFQEMDTPPEIVGMDDCPETNKSNHTDICGLGVKEGRDVFGVGLNVVSMSGAAACNGKRVLEDREAMTLTADTMTGTSPLKAEFYIDSNGVETGGCNSSNNAQIGFEFKIVIESTLADKKKVNRYECINRQWESTDVEAATKVNAMCQEVGGPIVMIEKSTLLETGKWDMTEDIRLYALTKNLSSGRSIDAVSGKYTPGATDTFTENCFGFEDMDGDGLAPDQDPDCKDLKKGGKKLAENCYTAGDEDNDGFENCDDPDCKMKPECGGNLFEFNVENDTTQAKIESYEVDEFVDAAFVKYDSSEPANGSLLFYGNDSSCSRRNSTLLDIGITQSDVPAYKIWHDGPIDVRHTGFDLVNGTTYYFKLKVCDKAGNPCGVSACLNFTTETSLTSCGVKCRPVFDIRYDAPAGDENLNGTSVQWNFGSGYQAKGCNGKGSIKKNSNETTNISVKIGNSDASNPWNMEFKGMDVKGVIDGNKTSLGEGDIIVNTTNNISFVGMDHDKWEDIKDELLPDSIDICVPGNVSELWHCNNASEVGNQYCTNVTNLTTAGPAYNTVWECTEFTVPSDLGFSVYYGAGAGTDETGDVCGDGTCGPDEQYYWNCAADCTCGNGVCDDGESHANCPTDCEEDTDDDTGGLPLIMKGGGGGGAAPQSKNEVSKSFQNINAGDIKEMATTAELLGLTKVAFKAKNGRSDVEFKFQVRSTVSTSKALRNHYQFIEISKTNIENEDMEDITLTFKVNKSWMSENGLAKEQVAMYRWVDPEWVELQTAHKESTDTAEYYTAVTPGFSYFAIAEKESTSDGDQPTGCPEDALTCPDGTVVVRDPNNNCEFPACPDTQPPGDVVCAQDTMECEDGSYVSRDPNKNCEFRPCPIIDSKDDSTIPQLPILWISGIVIVLILVVIIFLMMRKHSEISPGHPEE
ncbi:PGF-pre-PGF domain-containing protein [Candidatus Woesearchaeota archaeon]|nr:PGF-pre-PGF domain-containing protein [Candidatus Woesearchaeota archaeon]